MRYQIVLTGGKNIVIDESKKNNLDRLLSEGTDKWIEIGNNKLKTSTIKGIFELESNSEDRMDYFAKENAEWTKEWSADLFRISKLSAEEKTKKELEVRIFPGLRLSKMHKINKEVKEAILAFFLKNPSYPRCPNEVWWPLIKGELQSSLYVSRWFDYVFRSDDAIYHWAKFNNIKICL